MRSYHITLSEEDIEMLEILQNEMLIKYDDDRFSRLFCNILSQKQKPYTNLDKVKDEMTIEDLYEKQVCEIIVKTSKVGKKWCKNKFMQFEGECHENGCDECCKKWLESEVKE